MSNHYTSKTTVRLDNQLLNEAKQDTLEQGVQKPSSIPFKTLPTRALGKPKLKVDFSSNASIQEMLDKELAVRSGR